MQRQLRLYVNDGWRRRTQRPCVCVFIVSNRVPNIMLPILVRVYIYTHKHIHLNKIHRRASMKVVYCLLWCFIYLFFLSFRNIMYRLGTPTTTREKKYYSIITKIKRGVRIITLVIFEEKGKPQKIINLTCRSFITQYK